MVFELINTLISHLIPINQTTIKYSTIFSGDSPMRGTDNKNQGVINVLLISVPNRPLNKGSYRYM